MHPLQLALLSGAIAISTVPAFAQEQATSTALGDAWGHLQALPPHVHMHVSADHEGETCYFIAANNETLTCGHRDGSSKGQHVFPRAEVKSVKLTRYAGSTAAGFGIGAGAGALVGVAAIHSGGWFTGDARAVCALIGAIGGAAIGGPTDMFRGPVVYRRPKPQS
jgi:hypothetical protein